MMTFVLLLLSFGLFDFAFGNHLRIFKKYEGGIWKISLNSCEWNNESLVTVYDEEDTEFAFNFIDEALWFGLHKRQDNVTTWSNGKALTYNVSKVTITGDNQICEAMGDRTWEGFNCSDRKPFMCYKDNNYKLIEEEKNWCQALQFCKRHYTDLVSISNAEQNNEVFEKGKNKTFWIGLQHDQWKWADGSCSTYRKWDNNGEGNCTILNQANPELLYRQGCEQESKTVCAKGNMRIKVIRQNFTWEQALDYCQDYHTGLLWIEDEEDQKAVDQWLNYTKVEGSLWIGLRQSSIFGFWIWSDRTVGYSNWKNGKTPEMPMSNQCGAIIKTDNTTWKWSDENCWRQLYFLCEEEM